MENARLKESLERLQKAVALGQGGNEEITNQFTALNEELSRRREECIQLKSLLASRTKDSIETAKEIKFTEH
ncbi:Myo5 [Bugula neritina]|uniref:Myo5 n=1 Tax=Bugula neritina TaxID=10212 RepID=A0A7J7JNG4_BUGNE|nr:Myo5 [Bugula neritina]